MSTNNSALVSIIIPVYNREKLVKRAVVSALKQTYANIEIIIVDNNSTDNTYKTISAFKDEVDNIKIFRNDENIGPVNNWIKGIEAAMGEYVKIIFSDDWISANYVEQCMKIFNDDVGLVFTPAIIKKKSSDILYYGLYNDTRILKSHIFLRYLLLTYLTPVSPGCGVFRKKDVLLALKSVINPQTHSEFLRYGAGLDVLIYLAIAEQYEKVAFVHNSYAFFLEHDESFTYANALDKYYIEAFDFFLAKTTKVKLKFFYRWLHNTRAYKVVGYLSNKINNYFRPAISVNCDEIE